ncbi:MAG TPA: hypothetical protein VK942_07800 [Actinomycetes bacterium]|nr:hypothetical protein [Actinomycetes bacterium]
MAELSTFPTQNSGPTGTNDSREVAANVGSLVAPGVAALKSKSGFRPSGGASPGLVTATGTPDANVHVAPFNLFLQNIRGSGLGVYFACLDAIKDINILSTPADPTNPRDDLIIAQQSDITDADANSDFLVRHVVGTPAGVPADPSVSGSTNFITLARVRVAANATSIAGAAITDLRTTGHAKSLTGGLFTVALGGLLPVASLAEMNALTGVYDGFHIWRSDLKAILANDGAGGWRYFSRPTDATVATSETTASTSFVDLATPGPAITLETGTTAQVTLTLSMFSSGSFHTFMGFAVSGASTLAAADIRSLFFVSNTNPHRMSATYLVTGLTAGSNTFTAKYRAGAGTGTFHDRNIIVAPC